MQIIASLRMELKRPPFSMRARLRRTCLDHLPVIRGGAVSVKSTLRYGFDPIRL
jgi:hypothetical protein